MFQTVCYSVHDVPKEVFEHLGGTSVIEMRSNFIVASSQKNDPDRSFLRYWVCCCKRYAVEIRVMFTWY